MHKSHLRHTVWYYLLICLVLLFLFFTNDFGLTDVQKTAIVTAVGVDREEDTFIVTSQIAIPQSSDQGKATETVQIVSRGKTVADAIEEINAKTGWYPKLVFCHLILLGEKTAEKNVLDALDFFLLDEYLSDNCQVAVCEGTAKDMLNVTALVDPSVSFAIQKVLSDHAERVGTVLPATLREFSIGYFSDSKSSYLPFLKTQPQQEKIGTEEQSGSGGGQSGNGSQGGQSNQGGGGGAQSGSSGGGGQSQSQSPSGGQGKSGEQDKPVFSASETALFVGGKRVETFTKEETFAFNAVKTELRLASYSVEDEGNVCTLTIKQNTRKTQFTLGADGRATMKINLRLSAGLLDYSKALGLEEGKDAGEIPQGAFPSAEKLLKSQIMKAYEKCRACGCDLFELKENLQKRAHKRYEELKTSVLQNSILEVSVHFAPLR